MNTAEIKKAREISKAIKALGIYPATIRKNVASPPKKMPTYLSEIIKNPKPVIVQITPEKETINEDAIIEKIIANLNEQEGILDAKVIKNLSNFDIKDLKHGGKYQLELRDIKGARLDRSASVGFNMNDQRWHGGGGGGITSSGFQRPTFGIVNGVNQIFTFAIAPNAVVVDQGRAMQNISSDGSINWTGTKIITLAIAPTFDIYAIA